MTIESTTGDGARWRNVITKECRDTPPPLGEFDWVEEPTGTVD